MHISQFAPKITRVTFGSSSDSTILESSSSITVWGFVVANLSTSEGTVIFLESADGSTTFYEIDINTRNMYVVNVPFLADAGLRVRVSGANFANLNVMVLHSQPGA